MRTFLLLGLIIAGLIAAAVVAVYYHLGTGGLALFGLAAGVAIAGEAAGFLLLPGPKKKRRKPGQPSAGTANNGQHESEARPGAKARPQAVAVIGVAWCLPFVVWICSGPRYWGYFDLVAAAAAFAFALFSLALGWSKSLQNWLYGRNAPPPPKSFYAVAALLTAFGAGGVLSAIFRG